MPSRKFKRHKYKTNRNRRNNHKKNDNNQQAPPSHQQMKQPQIVEMLQKLTTTSEYMEENKQTENDKEMTYRIKLKLCNYLKIPAVVLSRGININSHIFHHLPALPDDIIPNIFKLQSKFGAGSIILYATTPKNFYNHHFEIPSVYHHILPDKSCIINNNITFIPLHILKMMGIASEPFDAAKMYLVTVIIHDFPNAKPNFVFYQNQLYFNDRKFRKFLKKKKWSSKKFRRELPEFVKLFNSDQFQNLIGVFNDMNNVQYADNLCKLIHFLIPQNLASFIEDETQKLKIQKIMDTVDRNCEMNEDKYQYFLSNHYLESIEHNKKGFSMIMQFPFIMEAIQEIINIIGIDRCGEIFQDQLQKNDDFQRFVRLNKFQRRVEGKNCSYCNKKEIRTIQLTERFKKCKRCQSCCYCSIQCQKRHWNTKHRYRCLRK